MEWEAALRQTNRHRFYSVRYRVTFTGCASECLKPGLEQAEYPPPYRTLGLIGPSWKSLRAFG